MANHYSAGWGTAAGGHAWPAPSDAAYEQFPQLAPVAATRNVLLPVGGDHVIPSRWATAIHRDWNQRYAWPRFVTAVPREFFAAVRADAARGDVWITPQTRDMNPVYTGKDVCYVDTKQAQRQAETALGDGERLATLAWLAGRALPGGQPGQGVAAAGLRRASRRDHRHRGRPGLPGPAGRVAGGVAARRGGPRRGGGAPGRPGRHGAWPASRPALTWPSWW